MRNWRSKGTLCVDASRLRPHCATYGTMILCNMIRSILIASVLVCRSSGAVSAQSSAPPREVSLASLIGNPGAHDGQRVKVTGFFSGWHFEDCGLYLSKADFEQAIQASAVQVDWPGCLDRRARELNRRYAVVEGVFHADRGPYVGAFTGVIRDVASAHRNESLAEFRQRTGASWWYEYWMEVTAAVLFTLASSWLSYAVARSRQG